MIVWRAILLAILAGAPAAGPAAAQETDSRVVAALREARVGERYDGFLGHRAEPDAALRKAVGAVNIRRRALYTRLATQRGVTPRLAGIAAGCQLLARVAPGQAYLLPDDQWRVRAAGAEAPVPPHCGNLARE